MVPAKKILNVLSIVSAGMAIYYDFIGNFELFRFFKPLTTILIMGIPLAHRQGSYTKYTQYIVMALLFCLIGDVFLLNANYFAYGLAAFLVAHIIFTIGFISIDRVKSYPLPLVILIVLGLAYYWYIYDSLNELAFPVFFYFCFIILMCWQGIGLYIWRKKLAFKLIAIAVVLFVVSDSIIAFDKFKTPFEFAGILILTFYWMSISLLANSTSVLAKDF